MASCSFQLKNYTIGDLKVTMCHLTTYCKETSHITKKHHLMTMVKHKIYDSADISMRLQLLTLAPTTWSISKVQEFFQVR